MPITAETTEFVQACREGNVEKVIELLAHPSVDVNHPKSNQWTPLHTACDKGHLEVVRLLLGDSRVEVNPISFGERTPLHLACDQGHLEIVKLLLADPRVKVNLPDVDDWTPLYAACHEGHLEVVRLLLADLRVDVNKPKSDQWTPLHIACSKDHLEIVRLLLADPRVEEVNPISAGEQTPLYVACKNGHLQIAQLLLADPRVDAQKSIEYLKNEKEPSLELLLKIKEAAAGNVHLKDLPDLPAVRDVNAAKLFALAVFLSDGLVQCPSQSSPETEAAARRFFHIAAQLPIELQMVLCHRAVGNRKNFILRKDSELAFKILAKQLPPPAATPEVVGATSGQETVVGQAQSV